MLTQHSVDLRPGTPSQRVVDAVRMVSERSLRQWVEKISEPRHFLAESAANRRVGRWLESFFESRGFEVSRVGQFESVLALPRGHRGPLILVGAHFDSVPECPGADDNGSAVAAMMACAEVCASMPSPPPVCFASFNCEEDGLLGSIEFVRDVLPRLRLNLTEVHILEMVGYASSVPRSQQVPPKLPVRVPSVGDFLGLLANGGSKQLLGTALQAGRTYVPDLRVVGVKILLGLEKHLPVLLRSDHAPFWAAGIPALMWTDTSEFRNPNYHKATDTPETLDFGFLTKTSETLAATVVSRAFQL